MGRIRLLTPLATPVFVRSRVLPQVTETLYQAQFQGREPGLQAHRRFQQCGACAVFGYVCMVPVQRIKDHVMNHRIYQALGEEAQWVQEMKAKRHAQRRLVGQQQAWRLKVGKRSWGEWYWQRTILKMSATQRKMLAWYQFRQAHPFFLIPEASWTRPIIDSCPVRWKKQFEICSTIGRRLASETVCIPSGFLSPAQKAWIAERYTTGNIYRKTILYIHGVFHFIHLEPRP